MGEGEFEDRGARAAAHVYVISLWQKMSGRASRRRQERARFHAPQPVSSTLMDGGLYPPFRTSRYRPSGDSADDIGKRVERNLLAGWHKAPSAVEQKAAARERAHMLRGRWLRQYQRRPRDQ